MGRFPVDRVLRGHENSIDSGDTRNKSE
jgi:hypothetical protein